MLVTEAYDSVLIQILYGVIDYAGMIVAIWNMTETTMGSEFETNLKCSLVISRPK